MIVRSAGLDPSASFDDCDGSISLECRSRMWMGDDIVTQSFRISRALLAVMWLVFSRESNLEGADLAKDKVRQHAERRFDSLLFNPNRDASIEATQYRMAQIAARRIDAVVQTYELSDFQKRKLDLISRNMIRQLTKDIAERKASFVANEVAGQKKAAQLFIAESEMQALRKRLRGPYDEDSFFGKSLRNVLNGDQTAKFDGLPMAAAASNKPISSTNAMQLVRISRQQKQAYRIGWTTAGRYVWFWEHGKPAELFSPPSEESIRSFGTEVVGFDISSDASVAAVAEKSGLVTIVELDSNKERPLETGQEHVAVKFSPDSKMLVTASYTGPKARLWSTSTLERVREFDVGTVDGGLTSTFSPDGKLLAIGNRNSTTRVFDVESGALRHTLAKTMSQELRFDPTGTTLAVVYVDGQFALWDVTTGRLKQSIQAWSEELFTVDWSPDGSTLVTAGLNAPVTLWDAVTLKILNELGSPECVMSARFSPDGSKLTFGGINVSPSDRYAETWAIP